MQQFVNDLDARRGYSQNIQPIERTYSPCYKYKVCLLYLFCIRNPYKCIHLQAKGGIFDPVQEFLNP